MSRMKPGGWVVLWLMVAGPALAQPSVVSLPAADTSITVWNYTELLDDPTHQITHQQLLSAHPPVSFSNTHGRSMQLGFSSSDFWLRFQARTDDSSSRQWILHVLHFFANHLTMFMRDDATGQVIERYTGAGNPAAWDIPYQEGAFHLRLLPHRTYTIWLHMSGNNSKAFTPVISETDRYYQFIQRNTYFLALYNGILAFAIVFQLIFFGFTRERTFVFYALYLLSFLIVVLQGANGIPGEVYFWPGNDWISQNCIPLASSGCAMFGLFFYASGLRLKAHSPWLMTLFRLGYLIVSCAIVSIILNWSVLNATEYAVTVGLLFQLLTLLACVVSLVKGYRPARYYLLATLLFLAGMITLDLWHRGLIPINTLTTYCIPISSVSEVIFFTLAIANGYKQTQQQERITQQQLIETLQTQNQQISSALLQGQTIERQRVAADLHDNLGTTLSALRWSLEAMDKSKLSPDEQDVYTIISQQINQSYNDVRLLSHNLLPDELAKEGLGVALQKLITKLNRNTSVRFSMEGADTLQRLNAQTEFELYSICLELLNNTLKHAQATEAHITFSLENDTLRLTISDNGKGFDEQRTDGRGMQNVAARVDTLGGSWTIRSSAGQGVSYQITVSIRTPARSASQT